MSGTGHAMAACGGGVEVSRGRCWDCHVAFLRSTGQDERADRIVALRRVIDEGQFAPDTWLDGLATRIKDEYARDVGPDVNQSRSARRLRHGRPST